MALFNLFKKKPKDAETIESAAPQAAVPAETPAETAPVQPEPAPVSAPAPEQAETPIETPETSAGMFQRLAQGLSKTSDRLVGGMGSIFLGRKEIDDDLLEELEELFITSDIGVQTTERILEDVRREVSRKTLKRPEELKAALKTRLLDILSIDSSLRQTSGRPYVILVVGVNGTGKTTSIAKLAKMLKDSGKSVALAAGDTFRAAAIEQLETWANRIGVPIIKQTEGSDPAAVIFDSVQSAKARGFDVLIADTAGRLHNKKGLMDELKKIVRVIQKELPDAPHETLLVLDATSGQNAVTQAQIFSEATNVSGLVLTKLDGTAKGGVIIGIVDELNIPVKFIGFGEKMDDLRPFEAKAFIDALFTERK